MKKFEWALLILSLTVFFSQNASAQQTDQWVVLSGPKDELLIEVPANYLVYKTDARTRITSTYRSTTLEIATQKMDSPKRSVRALDYPRERSTHSESFEIGNFVGKRYIYDYEDSFSIRMDLGSSKSYYTVTATAKKNDNATLQKFLRSIRLDGKRIYEGMASNSSGPTVPIAQAKTSQIITDALKQTESSDNIKFDMVDEEKKFYDERLSRDLIVIDKPVPVYTDEARRNDKQGQIRARVEFLDNGRIGAVVIDPRLDQGLARNVAKVVNKIKFLPAEREGKPISVTKVLEYNFSIY